MPGALNQGRKTAMRSTMTAPPNARSLPFQPLPAVAGADGGAFGYGDVSLVIVASASPGYAANPRTKTGSAGRLLQQAPEAAVTDAGGLRPRWRQQPSLLASGESSSRLAGPDGPR